MELLNEWFPIGKLIKVDTPFSTDSSYETELMAALTLTGYALHKVEMGYHGKFVHTLGRIKHIYIMSRIDIFYSTCCLATQTVAPTLPGFQCFKRCVQYLYSHPHKPIFILLILMTDKISSGLHGVGIKLKTTHTIIV